MTPFGCVFDMDDTLYLERDYVLSGFTAVAEHVALCDPDALVSAHELRDRMWDRFRAGRRGSAFDELLAETPRIADRHTTAELVDVYRSHEPAIGLAPGVNELVDSLRRFGVAMAVISDGPLASQAAKARSLRVAEFADPIVLTDAWGREWWKPHPRAFEHVASSLGLPADRLVYVGDNPTKDFVAPARLGWHLARLRVPGQLHSDAKSVEQGIVELTTVDALRTHLTALATSDQGVTRS